MKKKSWITFLAAVAICLTAVSCSKESDTSPEKEFVENFRALVMGGKEIDSLQDWSTSSGLTVKISVDFGTSSQYKVYILPTPALYDSQAAYLGMVQLKSGESKTITVCRPAHQFLFYAACYDSDGHAVCKAFPARASGSEVVFSGRIPEGTIVPAEGNDRWDIPRQEQPDLTDYTSGSFVEVSSLDGEPEGSDRLRLSLSNEFTGYLPSLGIRGNMSVYVTGTWTLTFNQRIAKGNVLVVGRGGKIVIPEGLTLSASIYGEGATGQIFVQPGGMITGDGTVEYSTGSGTYCFNAGTINVKEVRLKGSSLYNTGILGSETATPTAVSCTLNDAGDKGQLINLGGAWLSQMTGDGLSLLNGSYLNVASQLTIDASSRLADGSYTYTPSLVLNGSSEGGRVIYMGNAAILETDDISIDNFGVWGPTGSNFTANAILKVGNCSGCITTEGVADTYLLDHVELVMPSSFPTSYNIDHLTSNNRLLHGWMNANESRLIDDNNYRWALVGNKEALVWNEAVSANGCGDDSRQTCTYGTSPSFNTSYLQKEVSDIPLSNAVYYAFETHDGTFVDYDYNDVVLRVSVPVDRGDGTFVSNVQLMCVGNTIKTNVLYNGGPFGDEVHSVIGVPQNKTANVSDITRVFAKLGEITFNDSQARIDQLHFSLRTTDSNGTVTTLETGETPLYLIINGSADRRWFWSAEGVNIGVVYPQFSSWASDMHSNLRWYDASNAVSTKVVSWILSDD